MILPPLNRPLSYALPVRLLPLYIIPKGRYQATSFVSDLPPAFARSENLSENYHFHPVPTFFGIFFPNLYFIYTISYDRHATTYSGCGIKTTSKVQKTTFRTNKNARNRRFCTKKFCTFDVVFILFFDFL